METEGGQRKPVLTRGHQGDMTTRHSVGSWIQFLDQKKDISGKTGEIRIKAGVQLIVMYPRWFLSFDNGTMVMEDLNSRGTDMWHSLGHL